MRYDDAGLSGLGRRPRSRHSSIVGAGPLLTAGRPPIETTLWLADQAACQFRPRSPHPTMGLVSRRPARRGKRERRDEPRTAQAQVSAACRRGLRASMGVCAHQSSNQQIIRLSLECWTATSIRSGSSWSTLRVGRCPSGAPAFRRSPPCVPGSMLASSSTRPPHTTAPRCPCARLRFAGFRPDPRHRLCPPSITYCRRVPSLRDRCAGSIRPMTFRRRPQRALHGAACGVGTFRACGTVAGRELSSIPASTVPEFNTGESSTATRWGERRQAAYALETRCCRDAFSGVRGANVYVVSRSGNWLVRQCVGCVALRVVPGPPMDIAIMGRRQTSWNVARGLSPPANAIMPPAASPGRRAPSRRFSGAGLITGWFS